MKWNREIRQAHRWISIVFTLCVAVNIGLNVLPVGNEELTLWVGLATLVPLVLLLVTGLYLFVLPYRQRGEGRGG